jgi:hypothetical protein
MTRVKQFGYCAAAVPAQRPEFKGPHHVLHLDWYIKELKQLLECPMVTFGKHWQHPRLPWLYFYEVRGPTDEELINHPGTTAVMVMNAMFYSAKHDHPLKVRSKQHTQQSSQACCTVSPRMCAMESNQTSEPHERC